MRVIGSLSKVYNFKGLYRSRVFKNSTVDTATLQSYAGKYEISPGRILSITREKAQLYAQATGQGKVPLFAEEQNKFYLKVAPVELEFVKNDKGEIILCRIYQNGILDAKRVE